MTYRQPDPERVQDLEREQLAELEALRRQHTADLATVAKMKSPVHALARHVPHGSMRKALLWSVGAMVGPLACLLLGGVLWRDGAMFCAWAALISGFVPGLVGIWLAVKALARQSAQRFAGMMAIFLGAAAFLCALVCVALLMLVVNQRWK